MTHQVLFDGPVALEYGQMYVMSERAMPEDPFSGTEGQRNGLCGSRLPGFLFLTTATHSGTVPVRVELWDEEPPLDASWPDVVEVSFEPLTDNVGLVPWGDAPFPLALPRQRYAVRYSGDEMDAARQAEGTDADPPDKYLLQFWPSDCTGTDRIVREGSQFAAMWRGQVSSG